MVPGPKLNKAALIVHSPIPYNQHDQYTWFKCAVHEVIFMNSFKFQSVAAFGYVTAHWQ
jgi:hypothetical protein